MAATARGLSRVGAAIVVGLAALIILAPPAAADPPEPTNYRSQVTGAEPALPEGVTVQVVGGDGFLELSVPRGTVVVVPDYGQEADADAVPYLRFDADGTVRRNDRSTARFANEDRYGRSDQVPDPEADPRWTVVARDGTYAWHDHRIHWMSPRPPQVVGEDGLVDLGGPGGGWEVPLLVDGEAVTVQGRLDLLDAPSPLPWTLLAVAVGAGAWALGHRRPRALLLAAAALGVAAAGVSAARWQGAPAGSGATLLAVAIALCAVIGAALVLVGPARARVVGTALVAAGLIGWAVTRLDVLVRAVLPTPLPAPLDRGVTAAALAVGVAVAAGLVVRSSPTA